MGTPGSSTRHDVAAHIRDIPDFPEPGIVYKDITPLLANPAAFDAAIDAMCDSLPGSIDVVAGIESRGFMFAVPIAQRLGVGFVPVRKPGKLPADTHEVTYELEYGTDTLQVHVDAFAPGQQVLLVDDVLATGGTLAATEALVAKAGATVAGITVLLELLFLEGRARLRSPHISSVRGVN